MSQPYAVHETKNPDRLSRQEWNGETIRGTGRIEGVVRQGDQARGRDDEPYWRGMTAYLLRRLSGLIVLLFGISVLVFLMIRLIPGDPATAILGQNATDPALVERLRGQLGLNQSLFVQYMTWAKGVLTWNFGYSYSQQRSVTGLIAANLGPTVELTIAALALTVVFGLLLGVMTGLKRGSAIDTGIMGSALAAMSLPSFWLGSMLLVIFAVRLPLFAVAGGTGLSGLVLPAVTLALGGVGFLARFVRSSVVDTARQKYVTTARAKGLSHRSVVLGHVVRNALLPVLTVVGLQLGNLLAGTVIVETVFSRPGIGRLLVDSILQKDYLTVQAVVLLIAVVYAIVNVVVDLLYPILDPRVAAR
jgi:ABC-type dipeptide/oligopeptide/nickel transport system permease component